MEWAIIFVEYIDREARISRHVGCSHLLTLLYSLQEFGVYGSFIYQPFDFSLQGKAILDLMPPCSKGNIVDPLHDLLHVDA